MLLVVMLIGMAAALLVYGMVDTDSLVLQRNNNVAAAFEQAKQAMIGRAVVDQNRPGSLPCPDIDNDGVLTLNVDYFSGGVCARLIGRLPWRTLDCRTCAMMQANVCGTHCPTCSATMR